MSTIELYRDIAVALIGNETLTAEISKHFPGRPLSEIVGFHAAQIADRLIWEHADRHPVKEGAK